MEYLDGLRQDTRLGEEVERGISAQTFNFYLQGIKQFCSWMVKDRRAHESPVGHLDGLNVKTDRRHDRRSLSVEELLRLLQTTADGADRYGMTGPQRAMLYRVAVETGLRAGELRSLNRASFSLDGKPATVTVAASYSKHRRDDTLPLRPGLAESLKTFLAMHSPAATVFGVTRREYLSRAFKEDLVAAGIDPADTAGRIADFHALRHTFISNLASGGVHPKVAQTLARHSTITLTMNRYSHTFQGDETAALATLPDLTRTPQQREATGDGRCPACVSACLGVLLGVSGRNWKSEDTCGTRKRKRRFLEDYSRESPRSQFRRRGWDSNPRNGVYSVH